jgi:hypothetical protein
LLGFGKETAVKEQKAAAPLSRVQKPPERKGELRRWQLHRDANGDLSSTYPRKQGDQIVLHCENQTVSGAFAQ